MDLAWLSLASLVLVIAISCTTQQNPGVIALALAWFLGVYVAEWLGKPIGGLATVIAGFPVDLFLTLTGVTLLFSLAAENGTLEILSRLAVRACRGDAGLLPWAFFFMTAGLATVGAGNIAAAALMAPTALLAARRAGIPAFLMVVMLAHGALAGGLSPVAPTGVIAMKFLPGYGWTIYGWNLLGNVLIAVGAYAGLGGWRLLGTPPGIVDHSELSGPQIDDDELAPALRGGRAPRRFTWKNALTLVVIASLLGTALAFKMTKEIGFTAFAGAVLLIVCRAADERRALQGMPWSVTLMVCGVATLTALLEKTEGIQLFADLLNKVATPVTAVPLLAGLTGILSVYSSTSGVIMPAFLPLAPELVEKMGGGSPLALSLAVIVGGHLVDSSPLSTIGALCLAPVEPPELRQRIFRPLLAWGMSMTVVGSLLCWAMFGWMR